MPLTRTASKGRSKVQRLIESDDENAPSSENDEPAFGLRRSRLAPTLDDVLSGRHRQLIRHFKHFARNSPANLAFRFVKDRRVVALRRVLTSAKNSSAQIFTDTNSNNPPALSSNKEPREQDAVLTEALEISRLWFDFEDSSIRTYKASWENILSPNLLELLDDFTRVNRLRRLQSFDPVSDAWSLQQETQQSEAEDSAMLNAECGALLARAYDETVAYLTRVFESKFLVSVHFLKYQLDLLTSGRLTVHDVAYYEPLSVHLIELLELKGALDLLLALLAFDTFEANVRDRAAQARCNETEPNSSSSSSSSGSKTRFSHHDAAQLQTDATALYNKYVRHDAAHSLGFSEPIRSRCETQILIIQLAVSPESEDSNDCDADDAFRAAASCFEAARRVVVRAINRAYLHQFVQTEAYYAHVTELVRRLQHSGLLNAGSHKSAASPNPNENDADAEAADGDEVDGVGDADAESGDEHSITSSSSVSTANLGAFAASANGARRGSTTCSSTSNNVDWPGAASPGGQTNVTPTTPMGTRLLPHAHLNGTPLGVGLSARKRSGLFDGFMKNKRDKQREEEAVAAQIARMVIQDVQAITTLGASFPNTIDQLPI